jgi:hypothetical protein
MKGRPKKNKVQQSKRKQLLRKKTMRQRKKRKKTMRQRKKRNYKRMKGGDDGDVAEAAEGQKEEDQRYLTETDGWGAWAMRVMGMTPSGDIERLKERARLEAKARAEKIANEKIDSKDKEARKQLVQALTKLLLEGNTPEDALKHEDVTKNSWLKGKIDPKRQKDPHKSVLKETPEPDAVVDRWMGSAHWVPRHLLKPGDHILLSSDGKGEAGKNAWMDATVIDWSPNSSATKPLKIRYVNSGSRVVKEWVAPTSENIRIAPAKKREVMRLQEIKERSIDEEQRKTLKETMERWVAGGGGRKKKPKRKPSKKKKKSRSRR